MRGYPLTGNVSAVSVRQMNTLPLRTLLREPLKVKRMTKSGMTVRITDRGQPLWDLLPVEDKMINAQEDRELDQFLEESARMKPCRISLGQILDESRR